MVDQYQREMVPRHSALAELARHVERDASGEFISASASAEVHVFLQHGRVAWAVEASRPLSFVSALRERCGLSDADLRTAFDESRRERVPLGETLARWSLASWEDIRWSLEKQLVSALGALAKSQPGQSMFLDRSRFGEYDERLTFSFESLVMQLGAQSNELLESGRFTRALFTRPPSAATPDESSPALAAAEVLVSVRGAERVEVLRDGHTIDSAGRVLVDRERCLRLLQALDDGASLVAAHSTANALVGAHITGSRDQVWLYLGSSVTLGSALLPLTGKIVSAEGSLPQAAALAHTDSEWAIGDEPFDEADSLFAHSEVLAVFVADEHGEMRLGRGRGSLDLHEAVDLAERRCRLFASAAVMELDHDAPSMAPIGYRVATREASYWCLGGAIGGSRERRSVWVIIHPSAGLAIGWACLAALARVTAHPSTALRAP
jgi:hypothetical protein